MKGIINIGSTCYMNAALQLLLSSNDFIYIIKKYSNINQINIIYKLIKDYNSNISAVKPLEFKNMINNNLDLFNNYQQQDCFEFIVYFLDLINNLCDNNINKIFGISINVNLKCKITKCHYEKNKNEINNFLILPLCEDLNQCYREYKKVIRLEDDIYCEKCKKNTPCRKFSKTISWPNNLIIVLNRFTLKNNKMIKNNQDVTIPLIWRHNYNLVGCVIHSGGIDGGHYYYYKKYNNDWYIINDSNISKINNNISNLVKKSYILFFKK